MPAPGWRDGHTGLQSPVFQSTRQTQQTPRGPQAVTSCRRETEVTSGRAGHKARRPLSPVPDVPSREQGPRRRLRAQHVALTDAATRIPPTSAPDPLWQSLCHFYHFVASQCYTCLPGQVAFGAWPFSSSTVLTRFVHVVGGHSFLLLWCVPGCWRTSFWNHPPTGGHLGSSQLGVRMPKAAVTVQVRGFCFHVE